MSQVTLSNRVDSLTHSFTAAIQEPLFLVLVRHKWKKTFLILCIGVFFGQLRALLRQITEMRGRHNGNDDDSVRSSSSSSHNSARSPHSGRGHQPRHRGNNSDADGAARSGSSIPPNQPRDIRTLAESRGMNAPRAVHNPNNGRPMATVRSPLQLRDSSGPTLRDSDPSRLVMARPGAQQGNDRRDVLPQGTMPTANYAGHREMQTNSHIALLADHVSQGIRRNARASATAGEGVPWRESDAGRQADERYNPVETQVGFDPSTRRLVIAQNNHTSARALHESLSRQPLHERFFGTSASTPEALDPRSDTSRARGKLFATRMSQRPPADGDENSDLARRNEQVDALFQGRVDIVVGARSLSPGGTTYKDRTSTDHEAHAELQVNEVMRRNARTHDGTRSASEQRAADAAAQSAAENTAGTKQRCTSCAMEEGSQAVALSRPDPATRQSTRQPVSGQLFRGTDSAAGELRGRTTHGSIVTLDKGHTRARSTTPDPMAHVFQNSGAQGVANRGGRGSGGRGNNNPADRHS